MDEKISKELPIELKKLVDYQKSSQKFHKAIPKNDYIEIAEGILKK